jgi:hypothetical protein
MKKARQLWWVKLTLTSVILYRDIGIPCCCAVSFASLATFAGVRALLHATEPEAVSAEAGAATSAIMKKTDAIPLLCI